MRAQALYADGTPAGARAERPSRAQEGTGAILDALTDTILEAKAHAPMAVAVGLAIPGHVDDANGTVVWAPNFGKTVNGVFEYWENVAVAGPLRERVDLPIHMGNDANLAALGEYRFGLGENSARCLVMITLGTGIGGGVVLGPQAVQGKVSGPVLLVGGNHGGGELGHTVVLQNGLDCNAGTYGAIEAYCQRDAIVRRALHRLRRGRKSILPDLVKGDLSKIEPATISQAADAGDALAIQIWREIGTALGVGIGNFINIFAPDIVAIGGQVSKAGEHLLGPAREAAQDVAIRSLFEFARIEPARHVEDAGILGGAALAAQMAL